jgi:hypothetical protein
MNTQVTTTQIKRLKKEWELIAKEDLIFDFIKETGVFYAFCSELASLRLLKTYRDSKGADCGFSKVLNLHFFRLQTTL